MIDIEYDFYKDKYFGVIIEDGDHLRQPVIKANTYLNQIMHLEPSEEEVELVKMCLCEVAEMIYQDTKNRMEHGGREIQSENTDGYSVNYATEAEAGKIAVNSLQTKIYTVIRRYLSHTGTLILGGSVMITNATITIFNRVPDKVSKKFVYVPHVIQRVWFHTKQKSRRRGNGLKSADEYQIRIPYSECGDWITSNDFLQLEDPSKNWTVQNGDLFIVGVWNGADRVRE